MKAIIGYYITRKRYKHYLIMFLIIGFVFTSKAQEQFQLTNFIYSIHAINPAFTGLEDAVNLNIGYRRQWAAVEGTPLTYYAGFNGTLSALKDAKPSRKTLRKSIPRYYGKLKKVPGSTQHGVGLYVSGESFGPYQETSAYLSYSFMLQVSEDYLMALGISTEYANQHFNLNQITLFNPDLDQVYQQYANSPSNISRLNFNVGVLIYGRDLFAGYSLHQFASIRLSNNNFAESGYQGLYHFVTAGYNLPIGHQFTLQPSTLVRYNKTFSLQADVITKLIYRKLLWAGFLWSYDKAIGFLFGIRIANSLYLGYSYEYDTGDIRGYSQGTHELVIGYRLFSDRNSSQFLW